jgi:hypothetical protein
MPSHLALIAGFVKKELTISAVAKAQLAVVVVVVVAAFAVSTKAIFFDAAFCSKHTWSSSESVSQAQTRLKLNSTNLEIIVEDRKGT